MPILVWGLFQLKISVFYGFPLAMTFPLNTLKHTEKEALIDKHTIFG
jgi:hypothetical protein